MSGRGSDRRDWQGRLTTFLLGIASGMAANLVTGVAAYRAIAVIVMTCALLMASSRLRHLPPRIRLVRYGIRVMLAAAIATLISSVIAPPGLTPYLLLTAALLTGAAVLVPVDLTVRARMLIGIACVATGLVFLAGGFVDLAQGSFDALTLLFAGTALGFGVAAAGFGLAALLSVRPLGDAAFICGGVAVLSVGVATLELEIVPAVALVLLGSAALLVGMCGLKGLRARALTTFAAFALIACGYAVVAFDPAYPSGGLLAVAAGLIAVGVAARGLPRHSVGRIETAATGVTLTLGGAAWYATSLWGQGSWYIMLGAMVATAGVWLIGYALAGLSEHAPHSAFVLVLGVGTTYTAALVAASALDYVTENTFLYGISTIAFGCAVIGLAHAQAGANKVTIGIAGSSGLIIMIAAIGPLVRHELYEGVPLAGLGGAVLGLSLASVTRNGNLSGATFIGGGAALLGGGLGILTESYVGPDDPLLAVLLIAMGIVAAAAGVAEFANRPAFGGIALLVLGSAVGVVAYQIDWYDQLRVGILGLALAAVGAGASAVRLTPALTAARTWLTSPVGLPGQSDHDG
jgi:hypothetical protein